MNILKTLNLLIFTLMANLVLGQGGGDSTKLNRLQELKKLRKELYTQKLALTADEAAKFFPIFDEYEQKLRDAKKEFHKKWKGKKPEDLTEDEAKQYLADATKMREKELELFKTYSEKLKTAIPVKKIIILPRVTKEVQKELIAKAKEMKGQGRPGGRGMGQGRRRAIPR